VARLDDRLLGTPQTAHEGTDGILRSQQVRDQLLLRQAIPDEAQAETCLHQALAIARHQQTKAWELRAAVSLARLWQRQGKQTEARELLTPIYGWFTEGFDTADLQEAKALLEELASPRPST
jgi:predicted ATPase